MKITRPMLRHLVAEERATAKKYRAYGFKLQAKQEHQHSKFFAKLLKKRKNG